MFKKEALLILLSLLLIALTGCGDKCPEGKSMIDEACCPDSDNDGICDKTVELNTTENNTSKMVNITMTSCGDGNCTEPESCKTCWQDCGACKEIVYVYVPRNFTLARFTNDIKAVNRLDVKFKKDIEHLNNVSDFLFYKQDVPRFFAWFMDVKYKQLKPSRWIVVNRIMKDNFFANDSASLFNYVNYSDWYLTNSIKNIDQAEYEARILSGDAKADYPTPPTGHEKEFKYKDWEYRKYTVDEQVFLDNVTILDNGMVESVLAVISLYDVVYKYHEFFDSEIGYPLEDFKTVRETRLDYIHTLSFICSKNTVITLYEYEYDARTINEEDILKQLPVNRAKLITRAKPLRQMCREEYLGEMLVY
ncbi:hypothetical protein KY362_02705 [Candidatus Woesearchaeota archaeon]|nr:hypothetical protein [Candidatus Woesearchaeota archaeon]